MSVRRHDPRRREKIIAATLEVIVSDGVAGTTFRTVAVAAGVPLGSMTYHFPTRGDLLLTAFAEFTKTGLEVLQKSLMDAPEGDSREGIVLLILADDGVAYNRLLAELYVLAFHDEAYAALVREWMGNARSALGSAFPGIDVNGIDALQHALRLHRWFLGDRVSEDAVRVAVHALTTEQAP